MKKRILVLLAGAMLLTAFTSGIASAYSINYLHQTPVVPGGSSTNGGYTSPVTSALVETFDPAAAFTQPWTWTGSYSLISNGGNTAGRYSAPSYVDQNTLNTKESTDYISVPLGTGVNPSNTGSVTVNLGGGLYNYFGLWWGSIDTYNTLEFYNGATLVATITGSDVTNPNPANGGQVDVRTNKYVNIDFGGQTYDSFRMISTNFAFEADNIAVGNVVPEPGTMMLLGIGMLGLAIYGKRRMNKEV